MTKGELANATRRALNIFDAWNNVTGAVERDSGWYFELQSVIEDAVHCGAQAATGDFKPLEGEPQGNCPPKKPESPVPSKAGFDAFKRAQGMRTPRSRTGDGWLSG